ncbi:hypothetical protein GGR56DRAFT_673749 [Xylariaceae sp. FL0804]|nr:hypothetical protein GGR56DRAFT_673749 [Xylariaceae sp. FL0804]
MSAIPESVMEPMKVFRHGRAMLAINPLSGCKAHVNFPWRHEPSRPSLVSHCHQWPKGVLKRGKCPCPCLDPAALDGRHPNDLLQAHMEELRLVGALADGFVRRRGVGKKRREAGALMLALLLGLDDGLPEELRLEATAAARAARYDPTTNAAASGEDGGEGGDWVVVRPRRGWGRRPGRTPQPPLPPPPRVRDAGGERRTAQLGFGWESVGYDSGPITARIGFGCWVVARPRRRRQRRSGRTTPPLPPVLDADGEPRIAQIGFGWEYAGWMWTGRLRPVDYSVR